MGLLLAAWSLKLPGLSAAEVKGAPAKTTVAQATETKPAAEKPAAEKPAAEKPAAPKPTAKETPAPAVALPAKAPGAVAIVNMDRVEQGYSRLREENQKFEAWRRDKKQYLDALELYVFLTDAEFGQLVELEQQEKLNDADREKLGNVKKQGGERDKEFGALQRKKDRNEKEEGRFQELKALYDAGQARLRTKYDEINKEYDRRLKAAMSDILAEVKRVVGEIGKEMELAVVVDSETVLFGGLDITDRVIERLKAAPAEAGK